MISSSPLNETGIGLKTSVVSEATFSDSEFFVDCTLFLSSIKDRISFFVTLPSFPVPDTLSSCSIDKPSVSAIFLTKGEKNLPESDVFVMGDFFISEAAFMVCCTCSTCSMISSFSSRSSFGVSSLPVVSITAMV